MNKKILILSIVIVIILSLLFYSLFIKKELSTNTSNILSCHLVEESKKYKDWDIYINEEFCFSVEYPKDWYTYSLMNQIGYIYFNDSKISFGDLNSKMQLTIKKDNYQLQNALLEQAYILDPEILNFDIHTPAIRIRGPFKKDIERPWVYMDNVFWTEPEFILRLIYTEKEYNQADREVFDKMVDSLRVDVKY